MIGKIEQLEKAAIHYSIFGESGSPVVLLHGGGTDSGMLSWKLTVEPLAQAHRAYVPDWPGYGQSTSLDGEYSNEALIALLDQLLDLWQLESASLVGVSMGGSVALGYALAHPEHVHKLVLVDSYGLQDKAPFHKFSYLYLQIPFLSDLSWASLRKSRALTKWSLQNIFHDPNAISDELVEEVFQAIRTSRAEQSFYAWQRSEVRWQGLSTYYGNKLHQVKAPTLVIHGENDSLVPLSCARQAAEGIPDARLHIIPACGHWPQREKPEEFNRILVTFLSDGE